MSHRINTFLCASTLAILAGCQQDDAAPDTEEPAPKNAAPDAVLSVARDAATGEVVLDGSASTDPDGVIVSYLWTLGDGATAEGAVVRHRYAEAGTFDVSLLVTDDADASARTSDVVTTSRRRSRRRRPHGRGPSR